jgi:hypothetical protein
MGGLTMNDTQNPDWLELSRLLQQARPLVAPLYPDQYKQWAKESPLAVEISALLAKHPEYYDEIHAQIGGVFAKP